jgi:hypothetical protein
MKWEKERPSRSPIQSILSVANCNRTEALLCRVLLVVSSCRRLVLVRDWGLPACLPAASAPSLIRHCTKIKLCWRNLELNDYDVKVPGQYK